MLEASASVRTPRRAAEAFALVDDFARAPEWLAHCAVLRQTSAGPRGAGTTLHYEHRQGNRRGSMEGTITAYEPGRRLSMRFADSMFEVVVAFEFEDDDRGSTIAFANAITLKTLAAKLMTPFIRTAQGVEVEANLARLKDLLEAPPKS